MYYLTNVKESQNSREPQPHDKSGSVIQLSS